MSGAAPVRLLLNVKAGLPTIDRLIAATGLVFNMLMVTRNISGMEESGVLLLDPWHENEKG